MAPPSKLAIATSAVSRLVKEEASYHKEQQQQEARIKKLEAGSEDENAEYVLKQEKRALDETKAVFGPLRQRLQDALAKLEAQLEENKQDSGSASTEDVTKAKEAVASAQTALRESA